MSLFKITLFFETQVKNRIFTSAAPVDVFLKKKKMLAFNGRSNNEITTR